METCCYENTVAMEMAFYGNNICGWTVALEAIFIGGQSLLSHFKKSGGS